MRPVVLISGDGHHAWLNTVALRGLRLPERDERGQRERVVPGLPTAGSRSSAPRAPRPTPTCTPCSRPRPKGVAGLVDLEFDQASSAWPEREAAGAELLRIRVGAYVDTLPTSWPQGCAPATRCPAAARWSRWAR